MKYFFKPDWFVILLTLLVLTTLGMSITLISWDSIASLLFLALIVSIMIFTTALTPLWVNVTETEIKVKLVFGSRVFDKSKIEIKEISKKDIQGSIRVFGGGGYGGYTGWFRNNTLGRYFMLITNKDELALIITDKGTKVVINYPKHLHG